MRLPKFFKIPIKSNQISADFSGGHHHHQGQSTSTSQDTAIVNYLFPHTHTQANPLRIPHEHCPPVCIDGGRELDWTLLISMHGKGSIINTNII
jgi:hypothetical protein